MLIGLYFIRQQSADALDRLPPSLYLACVGGLLYGSLFPPIALSTLAWVALIPLLIASARSNPLRGATCGLVFALAASVSLCWWLPETLGRFFELSAPLALLAFAGVATLSALPYAAFGGWVAWLAARGRATPLAVAAGWGVAEFARALSPLECPFGLLAYTQIGTPIAQTLDIAGPYALGMLIVAANVALAGVFVRELRGDHPRRELAVAAIAVVLAMTYGSWRLEQRFGEGEPIEVAVIQGGTLHGYPLDENHRETNLRHYLELTKAAHTPDLVFWPESAVDFYLNETSPEKHALLTSGWSLGVDLILGAPHYEQNSDSTRYYNSAFLIREGEIAGRYDKVRLVPFAEHASGGPLASVQAHYWPGRDPSPLEARAARVGTFLCWESLHPGVARHLALAGAELLANPSNDGWFYHPAPALMQLQIAAARAIENRRWLVRATSTGYSAVIDAHGRMVALGQLDTPQVLEATVRRSSVTTPYQRLGESPLALTAALAFAGALRPRNREFMRQDRR
jgi:apolipoprotein N-acyltransferase